MSSPVSSTVEPLPDLPLLHRYSFDYGSAHMIFLDTETDLGHGRAGPVENSTWNLNGPFGLMDEQVNGSCPLLTSSHSSALLAG